MRTLISILVGTISLSADALVDYSDSGNNYQRAVETSSPAVPKIAPSKNITNKSQARVAAPGNKNVSKSSPFGIELQMGLKSSDINEIEEETKLQSYQFAAELVTPYNFSLFSSYWMGKTKSNLLSEQRSMSKGNGTVGIRTNWLAWGEAYERVSLDFYGARRFKSSDLLASSRSDYLLGVETAKRFYSLSFGLAFNRTISGNPERESEVKIGNINLVKASIGMVVSSDIRFLLEGGRTTIDRGEALNKLNYTFIAPELRLSLAPLISLNLRGEFRGSSERVSADLLSARLFDLPAVYGNTLSSALVIEI